MRVIGLKYDGYIVEISKRETANLMNLFSNHCPEFKELKIGDEVNVKGLYEKYQNGENLRNDVKNLRSILNHLEIATNDIDAIISKKNDTEG